MDYNKQMDSVDTALLEVPKENVFCSRNNSNNNSELAETVESRKVDNVNPAPDGGWGWIVCVGSFTINFILDGTMFSFGILMLEMLSDFGEDKSITSWIGSAQMGIHMCMGPVVSILLHHYSIRQVVVTGSLLATAGFLLSVFAPSVYVLIVTYGVISGIGFGMIFLPAIIVVGLYFSSKRAIATGIATSGSGIGAFACAYMTNVLLESYNWRGTVLLLAGFLLHCVICGLLFRPLYPHHLKVKTISPTCTTEIMVSPTRISENQEIYTEPLLDILNPEVLKDHGLTHTYHREHGLTHTYHRDHDENSSPTNLNLLGNEQDSNWIHSVPNCLHKNEDCNIHKLSETTKSSASIFPFKSEQKLNDFEGDHFGSFHLHNHHSNLHRKDDSHAKKMDIMCDCQLISDQRNASKSSVNMKDVSFCVRQEIKLDVIVSSAGKKNVSNKDVCSSRKKSCMCGNVCHVSRKWFPLKLLSNKVFVLLLITFTMWTAQTITLTYLPELAVSLNISRSDAAFLISIVGFTNFLGRLVAGFIANCSHLPSIILYVVALSLAAVVNLAIPFCDSYPLLQLLSAVFGLCMAVAVSLRTIVLVEQLGLESLTESFGIVALFQGVAFTLSPPIAGKLSDDFNSISLPFLMSAIMYIISALSALGVVCLNCFNSTDKLLTEKKESRDFIG